MRINFTEARVKAIPLPATGRDLIYDEQVRELALRLTSAGARSWAVVKRQGAKVSWVGLGKWPAVPVAIAREQARAVLVEVAKGSDVVAERRAAEAKQRDGAVPIMEATERRLARLRERGRCGPHVHEVERIAKLAHAAGLRDLADPGIAAKAADFLAKLDVSAATRNRFRRHLVAIGREAMRWWPPTVLGRDPFLPLSGEGAPLPPPPVFEIAEAAVLVSDRALASEDTAGRLWALLLWTGCRLREGAWARWDRIDLDRRTFSIAAPTAEERTAGYAVKGSKSRTAELQVETVDAVRAWAHNGIYVFPDCWRCVSPKTQARLFYKHLERLGIPAGNRHIHSLRHTHACLSIACGVDSLRLRLAMGHAGPEVAAHYAAQAMRWRGQLASWNGTLRLRDPAEATRLGAASLPPQAAAT